MDRKILKDYLIREWTTLEDLSTSDGCFRIGRQLGAAGVIVGTLHEDNGYIELAVDPEGFGPLPKNADLFQATHESIRFPTNERLHSLLYERGPNYARGADQIPAEPGVFAAGKDGVTSPVCIFCPQPEYSDAARGAKYQGSAQVSVVVTVDGHITDVYVLKGAPFGLTEQIVETTKRWTLRPAEKDGKPVAARVSIETTWHLY